MDGSIPERPTLCVVCQHAPLGAPGDSGDTCKPCLDDIAEMDFGVPHPATEYGPPLLAHLAALEAWAEGGREGARRSWRHEVQAKRDGRKVHNVSARIFGREIDEPGGRDVMGTGPSFAAAVAKLIPLLSRVERTTNEILHPREANGVDDDG